MRPKLRSNSLIEKAKPLFDLSDDDDDDDSLQQMKATPHSPRSRKKKCRSAIRSSLPITTPFDADEIFHGAGATGEHRTSPPLQRTSTTPLKHVDLSCLDSELSGVEDLATEAARHFMHSNSNREASQSATECRAAASGGTKACRTARFPSPLAQVIVPKPRREGNTAADVPKVCANNDKRRVVFKEKRYEH